VVAAKDAAETEGDPDAQAGWERYVGKSGRIIGMKTFGASAPLKELQRKFGFEPERVTEIAKELVGKARKAVASSGLAT
jgi:transketolase